LEAVFPRYSDSSNEIGAERGWPVAVAYGIDVSIVTAKKIAHRGRLSRPCVLAGGILLAAAACNRQVDLGNIGDGGASLLWKATFEPGDLREWVSDGEGGTFAENTTLAPSATTVLAHTGLYAGSVTLSPNASMMSTNYLFRNQPSPSAAYYSAWFYVPSSITVSTWLSLVHFRGSPTGDGNNVTAIWDLNLYPTLAGGLAAQLYNYVTQVNSRQTFAAPIPVPLDSWVQFEVYFAKAADMTGRITVWQNGTQILDRPGVVTVPNDWLQWDAGGAAEELTPSPSTVYLDDAAISLIRLGPGS
jgi:hypothetical protein